MFDVETGKLQDCSKVLALGRKFGQVVKVDELNQLGHEWLEFQASDSSSKPGETVGQFWSRVIKEEEGDGSCKKYPILRMLDMQLSRETFLS